MWWKSWLFKHKLANFHSSYKTKIRSLNKKKTTLSTGEKGIEKWWLTWIIGLLVCLLLLSLLGFLVGGELLMRTDPLLALTSGPCVRLLSALRLHLVSDLLRSCIIVRFKLISYQTFDIAWNCCFKLLFFEVFLNNLKHFWWEKVLLLNWLSNQWLMFAAFEFLLSKIVK